MNICANAYRGLKQICNQKCEIIKTTRGKDGIKPTVTTSSLGEFKCRFEPNPTQKQLNGFVAIDKVAVAYVDVYKTQTKLSNGDKIKFDNVEYSIVGLKPNYCQGTTITHWDCVCQ